MSRVVAAGGSGGWGLGEQATMKTATALTWGEPLGFCVGFEPVVENDEIGLEIDGTVPLVADDGCSPDDAGLFYSGDDLIVRTLGMPPTPVQHPSYGELWAGPDLLLFRTQAELDAWIADMATAS